MELDPIRQTLTFAQAEGQAPIPQQLKLHEISRPLSISLWSIVTASIENEMRRESYTSMMGTVWRAILLEYHTKILEKFSDEFINDYPTWKKTLKPAFHTQNYIAVFDFLQSVMRNQICPRGLAAAVGAEMKAHKAAYFVSDGTIYPQVTPEEGNTIRVALSLLAETEFGGARAHLSLASEALTRGQYATSVHHSISSVESIAHYLEPSSGKLSAALAKLEANGRIHGGLKSAFASLYGYTSDAEGIRHALVFKDEADVDETDALFMIGACASFITFVIRRGELSPQ